MTRTGIRKREGTPLGRVRGDLGRVPQALDGVPHPAVFRVRVLTFLRGIGDSNVPAAKRLFPGVVSSEW